MSKLLNFCEKNIEVLIVEDESVLSLGIELSLNEMGYSVNGIASNSKKAIELVKQNPPDLVLMDINLKGDIDGIQTAKQIWDNYKIPIVFLTSYCDDKTIKKSMDCEPYGYLLKPCRDKELDATIQMAIHKHTYFFNNKKNLSNINNQSNKLTINENIYFDKTSQQLYKNNELVKLTGNESKFISLLCENHNDIISFERINHYIWRESCYDLGKMRTLVYRLKTKIKEDIIESIYEIGYKIKIEKV